MTALAVVPVGQPVGALIQRVPKHADLVDVSETFTNSLPRSAPLQSGTSASRYGLPATAFDHAWTVDDIRSYLQIGRNQTYKVVKQTGFPPALRTGRALRWNGLQVLAWVHGDDWTQIDLGGSPLPSGAVRGIVTATSAAQPSPGVVGSGPEVRTIHPAAAPHPRDVLAATRPVVGAGREVSTATSTATPAGSGPVVRRVVHPQMVHEDMRRARLLELTRSASRATRTDKPGSRGDAYSTSQSGPADRGVEASA
jgi:predicted DNA-binding transcriptional regulator AlpA